MEADGSKIAPVEARRDRVPAGGPVGGAERLDAGRAVTPGQHGVVVAKPLRQAADQGSGQEWHVPGHTDDGGGRFDHRGVDPGQGTEAGSQVGDDPEIRAPVGGLWRVRYQEGRPPEGVRHDGGEPIEDPLAPNALEPFRFALEPGSPTTGQDGAPHFAQ